MISAFSRIAEPSPSSSSSSASSLRFLRMGDNVSRPNELGGEDQVPPTQQQQQQQENDGGSGQHSDVQGQQQQHAQALSANNNNDSTFPSPAAQLSIVDRQLPPAGFTLREGQALPPVGRESVGQENIRSEDVISLGNHTRERAGSGGQPGSSEDTAFFLRPRPKNLVRKWPSMLMYLMSQANDDEWQDVMERVRSHPQECAIAGINGGMNSLHACCVRYPPLPVVQAILDADPSVVLMRNFNGETPLHIASYSSSEEVQALLVKTVPDAAKLMDQYGDSPLHFAARAGATHNLMEAFVAAAPSMISQTNERGVTPFWLLPRSFLETDDLEEVLDTEGEDYRDDWDSLALFLRYSYFPEGTKRARVRDEQGIPLEIQREDYTWMVHAAAATPSCPREVLKWLCRMFPEQALRTDDHGFTPLLLAVQQKEMKEPKRWDQLEDGFREDIDAAEGELQNEEDRLEDEEAALNVGDSAFLEQVFQRTAGSETDEESRSGSTSASTSTNPIKATKESVVEILLEWSPRSALQADAEGRLPLTHALLSGMSWKSSVAKLIAACPRALECRDMKTRLYNFQLAAMCSPQLDTVYSLVRSLPELLARSDYVYYEPPPAAAGASSSGDSEKMPAPKKRPPPHDNGEASPPPESKQKI